MEQRRIAVATRRLPLQATASALGDGHEAEDETEGKGGLGCTRSARKVVSCGKGSSMEGKSGGRVRGKSVP